MTWRVAPLAFPPTRSRAGSRLTPPAARSSYCTGPGFAGSSSLGRNRGETAQSCARWHWRGPQAQADETGFCWFLPPMRMIETGPMKFEPYLRLHTSAAAGRRQVVRAYARTHAGPHLRPPSAAPFDYASPCSVASFRSAIRLSRPRPLHSACPRAKRRAQRIRH